MFPGQGSQWVGMGKDLAQSFPKAAQIFDKANLVLSRDLKKIIFEGPEDVLKDTVNTQPALYVTNLAVYSVVKELDTRVDFFAGHSLGEYCALQAAGVFSFEDGLKLVQARANAMSEAGRSSGGAMAAILGLDDEKISSACVAASVGAFVVQPANFNCPGQVVISGHPSAVEKAMILCKEAGALKCVPLAVSGAFHSVLMNAAGSSLRSAFGNASWSNAAISVVSNVDAKPRVDVGQIQQSLVDQVSQAVRWSDSMRMLLSLGVTRFVELGPGKVLQGLLKKIDKSVACVSIGDLDSLKKGGEWLKN
jgi:[acyl-carrier-protein] S-malonyltransferase